jgi:hypothetical protein
VLSQVCIYNEAVVFRIVSAVLEVNLPPDFNKLALAAVVALSALPESLPLKIVAVTVPVEL